MLTSYFQNLSLPDILVTASVSLAAAQTEGIVTSLTLEYEDLISHIGATSTKWCAFLFVAIQLSQMDSVIL
jgi:hypothetical protein